MPQRILNALNNYTDTLMSKSIYWFGASATVSGGAVGVANDSFSKLLNPELWGWPDIAAIVSIFGGISFVVQIIFKAYLDLEKRKWEREDRKNDADS